MTHARKATAAALVATITFLAAGIATYVVPGFLHAVARQTLELSPIGVPWNALRNLFAVLLVALVAGAACSEAPTAPVDCQVGVAVTAEYPLSMDDRTDLESAGLEVFISHIRIHDVVLIVGQALVSDIGAIERLPFVVQVDVDTDNGCLSRLHERTVSAMYMPVWQLCIPGGRARRADRVRALATPGDPMPALLLLHVGASHARPDPRSPDRAQRAPHARRRATADRAAAARAASLLRAGVTTMTKTLRRLIAAPFRWAGLAWCFLIAALVVPAVLLYGMADQLDPPPVKTNEPAS